MIFLAVSFWIPILSKWRHLFRRLSRLQTASERLQTTIHTPSDPSGVGLETFLFPEWLAPNLVHSSVSVLLSFRP